MRPIERLVYERLKRADEGPKAAQRLLVPETMDPVPREADLLSRLIPKMKIAGFDIEPFGGGTFVIRAVPDILSGVETAGMIKDVLSQMVDTETEGNPDSLTDASFKLMACHSALRAHQSLTHAQLRRSAKANGPLRQPVPLSPRPSHLDRMENGYHRENFQEKAMRRFCSEAQYPMIKGLRPPADA